MTQRGPMGGSRGSVSSRGVAPRATSARGPSSAPSGGSGFISGAITYLDRFCAILPARVKLELAEGVQDWAAQKRRDAMEQLGLSDEPEPAPPPGPETFYAEGESR